MSNFSYKDIYIEDGKRVLELLEVSKRILQM